jgi:DNA-binding LytR/AlgR family response regulator
MSNAPPLLASPSGPRLVEDGVDEAPASVRRATLGLLAGGPPGALPRIAARRKRALVFIEAADVWAFEADARLTYVHSPHGRLDIDVSLAEIEASPLGAVFMRVHRSWLTNLTLVKALEQVPGETQLLVSSKFGDRGGIRVPVSRDRLRAVRETLLATAIGVRRREHVDDPQE